MTSTKTRTSTFDLIDEPWLPVGLLDGRAETWSLLHLFEHAHEARGLSEPSPLTFTATMRFLLAVLHRAYKGPSNPAEWATIREAGQFDMDQITRYLEEYRHRFDLFHRERPFAQSLDAVGKPDLVKPIAQLTFDRVTGGNPTLYDHSVDETPAPVQPGEAVRLVLTAHQYGFAGSQGRFLQTPMVRGYCLLLEGSGLFESLVLNLQRYDDVNPNGLSRIGDAPWWEVNTDPPIETNGNHPLGLTDLLTWRGRRILLIRDDDGQFRRCWYKGGYQVRPGITRDPFKHNRPSTDPGREHLWFPRDLQEDRALWRDSYAFFPKEYYDQGTKRTIPRPTIISWIDQVRAYYDDYRDESPLDSPSLVASGIVKATQATVALWRLDRLPLPIQILKNEERARRVEDATDYADKVWRIALRPAAEHYAGYLATKVDPTRRKRDDPKPNPNDVRRELASLRFEARYWVELDRRFQDFLTDLETTGNADDAVANWRKTLRQVATDAFFDATDQTNTDGVRMAAQAMGSRMLQAQLSKALGRMDRAD